MRHAGASLGSLLWRPSFKRWLGVLLMAPCAVVVVLLIVYPLAVALDLSFQTLPRGLSKGFQAPYWLVALVT